MTAIPGSEPAPPRLLLTVEEAARWLAVSRTYMFQLLGSGEVESVKVGRLRRVPSSALDAYVARLAETQRAA